MQIQELDSKGAIMEKRHQKIREIVERELSYTAHDLAHTQRVLSLCLALAKDETGIDLDVLIPAVLLHDIARAQEDQDNTGQIDHALLGAEMAEGILRELVYETSTIAGIKQCIKSHRYRSGCTPETIEAKILFDADKLDALGAVGIARSFMLAGEHGEVMYSERDLAEYIKENVGENGRIIDVSKHASNLEFHLKLIKIPQRLYTKQARAIAKQRVELMSEFYRVLQAEIQGER